LNPNQQRVTACDRHISRSSSSRGSRIALPHLLDVREAAIRGFSANEKFGHAPFLMRPTLRGWPP